VVRNDEVIRPVAKFSQVKRGEVAEPQMTLATFRQERCEREQKWGSVGEEAGPKRRQGIGLGFDVADSG